MRASIVFAALVFAWSCKGNEPAKTGDTAGTGSAAAPTTPGTPQDEIARLTEIAKNGPGRDTYPQADAVILESRDDIVLAADGTVTRKHHSIVRVLDAQRAKEVYADVHIPFDSKRETLEITTARTITPDGEAHAASPDEIGDIVPPYLADATIYSDIRERVVSFPAVDLGTVIELAYTRTTKSTPDPALGGELLLGAWSPIKSRVVTITAPAGTTPQLAVAGATLTATESSANGARTYTYTLADLPDRQREPGTPPDAAVLPRVVYGFKSSWAEVIEPVANRFLGKAVPDTIPAPVVEQAKAITAKASTPAAKAEALFAFVSHDIRSIELPLGAAGYEPNPPDVVLANRYGDGRDKVGLLLALCKAAGIDGTPVFVRTGTVKVIASVPTVAQFDRVIAKLVVDGKDVWVDPADEHGQYGVAFSGQDNLVLPVQRGGAELAERAVLDPATSVSATTAKLAIAANGDLDATYDHALTGYFADVATGQLRALKGENLDQFFQQSAARLGADAKDRAHRVGDTMSTSGPFAMSHRVSVPKWTESQGAFRVFELPPTTLDVAVQLPPSGMSTREYPLYIGTPRTHTADVSVSVPAGWKIAYVPPPIEGKAEGIRYADKCEATGQMVSCKTELVLDKLVLPATSYQPFFEAMAKLQAYERRVVLLTKS
jgi:transglutaminase-like putative cysteine protease